MGKRLGAWGGVVQHARVEFPRSHSADRVLQLVAPLKFISVDFHNRPTCQRPMCLGMYSTTYRGSCRVAAVANLKR